jgi:hypothetical protein
MPTLAPDRAGQSLHGRRFIEDKAIEAKTLASARCMIARAGARENHQPVSTDNEFAPMVFCVMTAPAHHLLDSTALH